MYQEVITYSFGFEYHGILFCWKNKELFRMPFNRDFRYYNKRKLKQTIRNTSIGYVIDGDFKSLNTLKELTGKIEYKEKVIINDCPF